MNCNYDCLNCNFPDCLNDSKATPDERKLSKELDTEILLARGIKKTAVVHHASADDETKEKRRAYYLAHKEEIKARSLKRYHENSDQLKAEALRRYHKKKGGK